MNWTIGSSLDPELVLLSEGVECYREFEAQSHWPDLGVIVIMKIRLEGEGPECTDFRLVSFGLPGGAKAQRIARSTLTKIPLETWVREAVAAAAVFATASIRSSDDDERNRLTRELPRRRTAMTDQRLAEVVHVHYEARQRGMSTVRAVAERFAVTDRTASRYIAEARSRGLIQYEGD